MSFDNLCKLLSEKYPDRFASWLLGTPQTAVKILKTELSIEPIRADSLILLQLQGYLLHLEFQTTLDSDPPLPLRMLDYWVRLYRLHRLPIIQIVVLLLPPPEGTVIETAFVSATTRHEYRVVKLWEEDPDVLLSDPALLPLAPLAATSQPQALLQQVVQQVSQLEPAQRQEISTYTQILAGLKFNKGLIRQLFREGMMRESVIYQEILEEGRQEGRQEVMMRESVIYQEILQEGRQEGRQEGERSIILRLLTHRVGELPDLRRSQIASLPLEELEQLGEALFDFATIADLETWLKNDQEG